MKNQKNEQEPKEEEVVEEISKDFVIESKEVSKGVSKEKINEEKFNLNENILESEISTDNENPSSEEIRKNLSTRLKRIEGQVKGIEKMVQKGCCCSDVLTQIAAVRAAINKVGGIIIENYAKDCFLKETQSLESPKEKEQNVEQLVETLLRFLK